MELLGNDQCPFAADGDERFDAENIEVRQRLAYRQLGKDLLAIDGLYKMPAVPRAQYRPAARQYAADALCRQRPRMRLAEDALKAVLDPDDVHPKLADRRPHDSPDRRVQPRRIAAACENTDLFIHKATEMPILLETPKEVSQWLQEPRRGRRNIAQRETLGWNAQKTPEPAKRATSGCPLYCDTRTPDTVATSYVDNYTIK